MDCTHGHACACFCGKQRPEAASAPPDLPLIAVGELHVHAVSAEEGPAAHRRVDVGWVRDGLAHQHSTGEGRLPEAAKPPRRAAVVHFQLSGAVQHLPKGDIEKPNVNTGARKTQIINSQDKGICGKIPPHTRNSVPKTQTHTSVQS